MMVDPHLPRNAVVTTAVSLWNPGATGRRGRPPVMTPGLKKPKLMTGGLLPRLIQTAPVVAATATARRGLLQLHQPSAANHHQNIRKNVAIQGTGPVLPHHHPETKAAVDTTKREGPALIHAVDDPDPGHGPRTVLPGDTRVDTETKKCWGGGMVNELFSLVGETSSAVWQCVGVLQLDVLVTSLVFASLLVSC